MQDYSLLDDTTLKVHQQRYGIDSSWECECGHGIDDAHHFFLECERHGHLRKLLNDDIGVIWETSSNEASFSPSVSFLLAPYNNRNLTQQEICEILLAVFRFIGNSSRRLSYFLLVLDDTDVSVMSYLLTYAK